MENIDIKVRADEERNRINNLLLEYDVADKDKRFLEPIIENVCWMKAKLDDARESIKNSNIAIAYDNGGGQKGVRENPLFKGYEALWKSYLQGMDKIIAVLPREAVEREVDGIEEPQTILKLVRDKHKVC